MLSLVWSWRAWCACHSPRLVSLGVKYLCWPTTVSPNAPFFSGTPHTPRTENPFYGVGAFGCGGAHWDWNVGPSWKIDPSKGYGKWKFVTYDCC